MVKNLKRCRQARNLQQKELAQMIDRPTSTIGAYESNTREPDIETLIKLADALDVSVDALVRDNSNIFVISKLNQKKLREANKVISDLNTVEELQPEDEGRRIIKKNSQKISIQTMHDNHAPLILNNFGKNEEK